ncbi:HAD-IC family P-type ATPase [Bradyrhizobium sp.]|jgi:cation-transporting ATPase E
MTYFFVEAAWSMTSLGDVVQLGTSPNHRAGDDAGLPAIAIDLNQPMLQQLGDLFFSVLEAPYSAFVSNILLVALAGVLGISALLIGWVTSHPDEVRRIVIGWRRPARIRRAERDIRLAVAFLLRRFDAAGAYGLSFATILAVLLLGIWFLGSALKNIAAYGGTALLDVPVASVIALHRVPWLTSVMQAMDALGSGYAVSLIAVALAATLWPEVRDWRWLVLLFSVVGGAEIMDVAIDSLVGRPGPPADWRADPLAACGFQPGQTTTSVFYGVVAYLIARHQVTWRSRVLTWSGATLVVFLIGGARLYLGTEWLTDVLGRRALALFWLSAVLLVIAIVEQTTGTPTEAPPLSPPLEEAPQLEPSLAVDIGRRHISVNGLSEAEAEERRRRGEVNLVKAQTSRTVADILWANVFTRFNALLGGLFVMILLISGKQDALFGLILIANAAIGVAQELRAKWMLDRLKVLVTPRAHVVRDGATKDIAVDQIVVDDVLELHPGDQVPVDGVLLTAQTLEVNESLLTGEAEPVSKSSGDAVLSGSFIVTGVGRLQTVRLGEASYSRRLARAAKQFSLSRSQLKDGINDILRYVTWALIPTATALFVTQLLYSPAGAHDAVVASIAGVVGMVPEGLVLLTSAVMAMAVIRLARLGALVQELAAVELLARVDVVCTDKTGTLTEGVLTLEKIVPANAPVHDVKATRAADICSALGAFAHNQESPTTSTIALQTACPPPVGLEWQVVSSVPFSSTRKWGSLTFSGRSRWILGAPEVVLAKAERADELMMSVDDLVRAGKRVLALASSEEPSDPTMAAALPTSLEAEALIVLAEKIRTDVAATIHYFEEQGVAVKVISGDHPETVRSVASLAGLGSCQTAIDARSLSTELRHLGEQVDQNSLFGRVAPAQKRQMVRALKDRGHVVAMIGDGINDVLAIKEADFGIALGSGTPASRAVAQLILLENNFAALPKVIAEGRRVIANVERTANLFITKTIYVFALALSIGVAQAPFPFLPRHLTLVGFLTIGAPGLFLSLARNTTMAQPGFISRVLRFSLPAGAIAAAATLLSYAATRGLVPDDNGLARTAATLALVGCGLVILLLLARPQTMAQWFALAVLPAFLAIILGSPALREYFALELPPPSVWAATAAIVAAAAVSCLATERPEDASTRRKDGR